MTPDEILLYSQMSISSGHHKRSFLLQYIGTNRNPQLDNMQIVRDLGILMDNSLSPIGVSTSI